MSATHHVSIVLVLFLVVVLEFSCKAEDENEDQTRYRRSATIAIFRFRLRHAFEPCLLCAVSKLKRFIICWLPVIVWLFVISAASGDQKSFQHSSRIIGPIVHWLFPQMPQAQVEEVVFYVRKSAHMAEFGVLALLCWHALRQPKRGERRPWSWPEARKSMLLVFVFAAADELHQCFVPSRQGSPWDVAIDCSGGALALWLLWSLGRRRKWW